MRILGFIFVSLIFGSAIVGLNFYFNGTFLDNFIDHELIPTLATLVGLNIAAVIFLLGHLISVEFHSNKGDIFQETRKELKHNSFFVLYTFLATFILTIFRSSILGFTPKVNSIIHHSTDVAIMTLFFMALIAIYEILHSSFLVIGSRE